MSWTKSGLHASEEDGRDAETTPITGSSHFSRAAECLKIHPTRTRPRSIYPKWCSTELSDRRLSTDLSPSRAGKALRLTDLIVAAAPWHGLWTERPSSRARGEATEAPGVAVVVGRGEEQCCSSFS